MKYNAEEMTEIEQRARKLCEADGIDPDRQGPDAGYYAWHDYVSEARKLLAALASAAN
ncbi:MAG: hypothetical protein K2Q12_07305 [Rickettsiales bacterium]|nr:hypothetical protein [Rickettsiales bacterium]